MRPRRLRASIGLAVAVLACGKADPKGLEISVDLNGQTPDTIRVLVSASPGGFAMASGSSTPGVTITNETDDAGQPAVALLFKSPAFTFGGKFSFLLDTQNPIQLDMTASALGFANERLNSGADAKSKSLAAAGHAAIPLTLDMRMGDISPTTRTTDLLADVADVTVKGGRKNAHLRSLASCNVDSPSGATAADDVVIGAPSSEDGRNLGPVGAVHVVLGGSPPAVVDLATVGTGQEFHFYGRDPGDELGFSVACADLNGDGVSDMVIGAPGANAGAGRVYVVFGRSSIAGTPINLANNVGQGIAVIESSAANGRFGEAVFAVPALAGIRPAELVIAAPGASLVHVLTPPAPPTGIQAGDVTQIVHATISGAAARAVVAGKFTGRRDATGALDVAVGDWMLHPDNDPLKQGIVYVFPAVDPTLPTGFAVDALAPLGQSLTLVGDNKSFFGQALLALDSGAGQDLVVGAPGEVDGKGRVHFYKNDSDFFQFPMRPSDSGQLTGPADGGHFGAALAVSVSGSGFGTTERLLVGAPDTTRGMRGAAGAGYVFGTSTARSFPLFAQIFGADETDHLGAAVAGGQVDSDMVGDFIFAAPDADGNGGNTGAGVVYVRFAR